MAKLIHWSSPVAAPWDYASSGGMLGGEDALAYEAMRVGHIIVFRAGDLVAISQDASFHQSDIAKQICRSLMLAAFQAERERFESRLTRFGTLFRPDEVGMDTETFESSYVCFLAPMLPRNADVEDARRYCTERCFVHPWFLIHRGEIHRMS